VTPASTHLKISAPAAGAKLPAITQKAAPDAVTIRDLID